MLETRVRSFAITRLLSMSASSTAWKRCARDTAPVFFSLPPPSFSLFLSQLRNTELSSNRSDTILTRDPGNQMERTRWPSGLVYREDRKRLRRYMESNLTEIHIASRFWPLDRSINNARYLRRCCDCMRDFNLSVKFARDRDERSQEVKKDCEMLNPPPSITNAIITSMEKWLH